MDLQATSLFRRKESMGSRSIIPQVRSGLRLAALTLLGIGVSVLFAGGVAYVFFPAGHSRILGCVFLILSSIVMVVTMKRWIITLVGVFVLGTWSALLILFTGHVLSRPSVPTPRLLGLLLVLFCICSSFLLRTFNDRALTLVDRIAVMGFLFSFLWAGVHDSYQLKRPGTSPLNDSSALIAMGIGLIGLMIAWAYHRTHGRAHKIAHNDIRGRVEHP
jgi:hypothetical protein